MNISLRLLRRVSFVTDLEGDFAYFKKFVDSSQIIRFSSDGKLDFSSNDGVFVHGGDLFDRGPGDIRLSNLLCSFYDKYPDRVILLLGNRDINKMRFSSELNLDVSPESAFFAWWDKTAPKYPEFVKDKEDSVLNRLQWALKHTLGCPNTFEFRREELKIILNKTEVLDDEVVQSFVDSVKENGCYFEYLKRGKLAARIEKTLFVHGAADPRGLGFVPNLRIQFVENEQKDVTGSEYEDLDEWIEKLNQFKEEAFAEWKSQPRWKDGRRGGDALMAYQNKPSIHNRTVCVSSFVDGKNMPEKEAYLGGGSARVSQYELRVNPLDELAWRYLKRGGICRVVVGHTPSGSSAAVLRHHDCEVISGDTNYATSSGTRGENVLEIIIENNRARLKGVYEGSLEYDCFVDEHPIGKQVRLANDEKPFWVKLRFKDERYLISRGSGRHSEEHVTKLD